MAFDARERSRWYAQPISLFRFVRADKVWRYCTSAKPVTIGEGDAAETFLPAQIARGKIQDSVEQQKNNLTISFAYSLDPNEARPPATQALGDNWRPYPPGQRVFVTVMGYQAGDAEAIVEWTGRVIDPKFTDTECELTCEPSNSPGKGGGTPLTWMRSCPLTLYSHGLGLCNADPELHAQVAELATVNGLIVTAAAFGTYAAGQLVGGYIEWERASDGLVETRTIMAHAGTGIQLQYGALDLAEDLQVKVRPGCSHDYETGCGYHANQVNYGGCRFKPVKNPFGGSRIA